MNHYLGRLFVVLPITAMLALGCARTAQPSETPRTAGDAINDATITASVKIALAFKPGVAATDINVDTDRGVVTLRGEVGTEAERQLAVMVARDVDSVTEVVNDIRVRG